MALRVNLLPVVLAYRMVLILHPAPPFLIQLLTKDLGETKDTIHMGNSNEASGSQLQQGSALAS